MTAASEDPEDALDSCLAVALAAARKARALVEDNADLDIDAQNDGLTNRRVYAHLLDVVSGIAGAIALIERRRKLADDLEEFERLEDLRLCRDRSAPTLRAKALRIVK